MKTIVIGVIGADVHAVSERLARFRIREQSAYIPLPLARPDNTAGLRSGQIERKSLLPSD